MNERKKALIALVILGVLLIIIIAVVSASLLQSGKRIEEIENVLNSKEPQIVYLSKPTCYYCNLIEPITDALKEEYNLDYYNINTGDLSNSELSKILDTIGINAETFGTPYIAIVQDGKIIDEQVGYTNEDVLFNLFKEHNLIKKEESLYMNYLNEIDAVWNSTDSSLILIGESGDTASIDIRLHLSKLAKTNSININYFDSSKLSTTEEYNELLSKLGVEKLPVLAIVQNGNIISKIESTAKTEYETFLKQNSYME